MAEFLSFHAFWKEMQPQLFHTSTAADRGTLLSAAVPMVLALTRGGAAMFTRSTPGCGTLNGPSLAWAASLWLKLRRSEESPGLRLPNERGQQSGPALTSDLCLVYTWYIQVYTWYILPSSKTYHLGTIELLSCNAMRCACIASCSYFHCFHANLPDLMIAQSNICMVNTANIHSIYKGYTMIPRYVILTETYAFWIVLVFNYVF